MVATGWTTEFSTSALNSVEIIDLLSNSAQCQNFPNFSRSTYGAGGVLDKDDNPIVCGGYRSQKCETFQNGNWIPSQPLIEDSHHLRIIKLPLFNGSVSMFATGMYSPNFKSAEILLNGSWENLPGFLSVKISAHCMVMLNSSALLIIGGKQDTVENSPKTHILNIKNQEWIEGPELKFGRRFQSCSRIPSKSQSSSYSIIVVGGEMNNVNILSSVEILDEGSSEWRKGPELPYGICCSAIVEHPLGGVALIGGAASGIRVLDTIYHLPHAGDDAQWKEATQKLKLARRYHTAFMIPDEVADYCDN